MSDLLVRLYDLPPPKSRPNGVSVRRALPPERELILRWIAAHFGAGWQSEVATGLSQQPPTAFIATRDQELLGFAAYDCTARRFFGPTGVDPAARGQGIGEALLMETLRAMAAAGYAYAIVGDAGPIDFYVKRLNALEIPHSSPGFYKGMLKPRSD